MTSSWTGQVSSLFADARYVSPASSTQIDGLEAEFQVKIPEELRSLLSETDGVLANYSTPMIWSIQEITSQNRELRTEPTYPELYMPFTPLLFFGDDGSGNLFGYRVLAGIIRNLDVFEWDHETDSRSCYAYGLRGYFKRRSSGVGLISATEKL